MPNDPLAGVCLKIERAKKHINDLEADIRAFRGENPYRVVTDEHPRTGEITYRLSITKDIPIEWSATIGDIIHNLRSSLDLLACALIRANHNQIKRQSGFPIAHVPKSFESAATGKIDGASDSAKRFIRRLKPYKSGNSALWEIHELDALDKHKAIVPVGATYQRFSLRAALKVPWQDELVKVPPIAITLADPQYPLKDGDILLRDKTGAQPTQGKTDYQFAIEIAFGEGQIVDGQPVIPTLKQYAQLVERIVGIAERCLL